MVIYIIKRKVNLPEIKSEWLYLSDLELPAADGSQAMVLIGYDLAEIITSVETRIGPSGSLGWLYPGL